MWAKVFGKENLVVRIFEPQQLKDSDLLTDFLSAIGFTHQDELFRPQTKIAVSMCTLWNSSVGLMCSCKLAASPG